VLGVDAEHSWRVIEHQRRSLADLLEGLSEEQWGSPSLCAGWRVRDVAAHVALAPQVPGIGSMLADAARAAGRFNTLNRDVAVRHAARPTERIVSELRQFAGSRKLPVVTNYRNILFDVLVHGQDIAIPLGLPRDMPLDAARVGAGRSGRDGGCADCGCRPPTSSGRRVKGRRWADRSRRCSFC
jgi:uncharacterized protein (TIGR03083 family)